MKKSFTIFFLTFYSLGTLLFPMGDLSYMVDLPKMYHHCQQEDSDMDFCDFVFEHLLNTDDIIGDHDVNEKKEQDKPHTPCFNHVASQVLVAVNEPIQLPAHAPHIFKDKRTYTIPQDIIFISTHLSQVFRPPIVA